MAQFPRWSNLKHFSNVSTTTFGDGQVFYDILKVHSAFTIPKINSVDSQSLQCILPCIVQLLPRNSIFIKCICTYQQYRLMIGLNCMSERCLQRLSKIIERYKEEFIVCSMLYQSLENRLIHYSIEIVSSL